MSRHFQVVQAAAINILVEKGGLNPTAAFAVAAAMEMSVKACVDSKYQKFHKYTVFWLITIALCQSMLPKLAPVIAHWIKMLT